MLFPTLVLLPRSKLLAGGTVWFSAGSPVLGQSLTHQPPLPSLQSAHSPSLGLMGPLLTLNSSVLPFATHYCTNSIPDVGLLGHFCIFSAPACWRKRQTQDHLRFTVSCFIGAFTAPGNLFTLSHCSSQTAPLTWPDNLVSVDATYSTLEAGEISLPSLFLCQTGFLSFLGSYFPLSCGTHASLPWQLNPERIAENPDIFNFLFFASSLSPPFCCYQKVS